MHRSTFLAHDHGNVRKSPSNLSSREAHHPEKRRPRAARTRAPPRPRASRTFPPALRVPVTSHGTNHHGRRPCRRPVRLDPVSSPLSPFQSPSVHPRPSQARHRVFHRHKRTRKGKCQVGATSRMILMGGRAGGSGRAGGERGLYKGVVTCAGRESPLPRVTRG